MIKKILLYFVIIFITYSTGYSKKSAGLIDYDFLNIKPSVVGTGVGNSYSAVIDPMESFYYNPASIGLINKHYINFFHNEYLLDIKQDAILYLLPINKKHKIGVAVNVNNLGDFTRTQITSEELPIVISDSAKAKGAFISIGYAANLSNNLLIGIKLNLVSEDIAGITRHNTGLDIGIIHKKFFSKNINLGLKISNISNKSGFDLNDEKLPLTITAALNFNFLKNKLQLMTDVDYLEDEYYLKYGIKVNPIKYISIFSGKDETNDSDNSGFNYGIAINIKNIELKYAVQPLGELGDATLVSIGCSYLFKY